MTLERLAAACAALGFVLYAVLDLADRGHGAPRTVVLVGSVLCVAVMRLSATELPVDREQRAGEPHRAG